MNIEMSGIVASYPGQSPSVGRTTPVSLSIAAGESVALIGPNGSGKTTLLRVLAKLHTPIAGGVSIGGKPLGSFSPRDLARSVAVVHQSPPVPHDLTVRQLVGHGRYPHIGFLERLSGAEAHIVDGAIERCDLSHLAERRASDLSGGERQRAWLAMAIAQQPRVLLLDEPTSALDVAHQLSVLSLVQELNQSRQTTVVTVLHDVNLATQFSDRVIALREGDVAFDEPADAVADEERLSTLYGTPVRVLHDPETDQPVCVFRTPAEAGA